MNVSEITQLELVLMTGFRRQPSINPVRFPLRVVSNVRVTHSCQFTGSVIRGMSGR